MSIESMMPSNHLILCCPFFGCRHLVFPTDRKVFILGPLLVKILLPCLENLANVLRGKPAVSEAWIFSLHIPKWLKALLVCHQPQQILCSMYYIMNNPVKLYLWGHSSLWSSPLSWMFTPLLLNSVVALILIIMWFLKIYLEFLGFSDGSDGKQSTCSVGDPGSFPGLGRSPGEGNGSPLQYSCLENPMNRGSLAGYSPWGHEESDMTEWLMLSLSESSHTISYVTLKIYPEVLVLKEHSAIASYSHLVSFHLQWLFYFHKFFIKSISPLIIDSRFLFLSNFSIFYEHFSHTISTPPFRYPVIPKSEGFGGIIVICHSSWPLLMRSCFLLQWVHFDCELMLTCLFSTLIDLHIEGLILKMISSREFSCRLLSL